MGRAGLDASNATTTRETVRPASDAFRVVVVDDEPLALDGLSTLLRRDPTLHVVAECLGGAEAIDAVESHHPHILFLDVQMPEIGGFDVLRTIGTDRVPAVVFVTAYDRFALQAFETSAVDYVLKPYEDIRITKAVLQAKRRVAGYHSQAMLEALDRLVMHGQPTTTPRQPARLTIREAGRVIYVETTEIEWVEGAGYYARIHSVADGASRLMRNTLTNLETMLDPRTFMRVHRSVILNLLQVREVRITPNGEGVAVLKGGTRVRVARNRRAELEARVAQLP